MPWYVLFWVFVVHLITFGDSQENLGACNTNVKWWQTRLLSASLLKIDARRPVFWRWHSSWSHQKLCSGWSVLDLGHYRCIQVEIGTSAFKIFFPHARGLVNKMLRLHQTRGLCRWLWEMKCTELYHIYTFLMSAGDFTHSSFRSKSNTNGQALGSLPLKAKFVHYFKNTCLFLEINTSARYLFSSG